MIIIFIIPFIIVVDPYSLNSNAILLPPSLDYFMGTDRLGRDMTSRILIGGQTSLLIGFLTAFITSIIGLIIGICAGYLKGNIDKSIVITIDLFLTFPTFFLLLALASYIEASIFVLIILLTVTGWMGMARMIRSESFAISNQPFIKILDLAKVSKIKIFLKYFSPLLAPIFLVSFIFGVGNAILAESGLSFLGLGINPPQISWGSLLSDGKEVMEIAWWVSFFPGFCIFIITFLLMKIANIVQSKLNKKDIIL
ncbi:Dipeptide transport system permease protein DppC (TC 3.A.1.5.2) [hydrothermal vent metagenome]|uniref:Dipeptide transport system permease protein DppC (TC 3.A.1.5.2) n=1 Tax=hydrothermal vent metagenome TaxID=652676 RepID=A0A3B1E6Y5_9ZZZZ